MLSPSHGRNAQLDLSTEDRIAVTVTKPTDGASDLEGTRPMRTLPNRRGSR